MKSSIEYIEAIGKLDILEKRVDEINAIEQPLHEEYLNASNTRRGEIMLTVQPLVDELTEIMQLTTKLRFEMEGMEAVK